MKEWICAQAGVLDDDLEGHLKKMKDDELLEDSIVIVMADHGHRFAKLRETHQVLQFFQFFKSKNPVMK